MLPRPLAFLLLAGALLLPLLSGFLILAGRGGQRSISTRLTLAALSLFGVGVGVMAASAVLAVLRVGLSQLHDQYLPIAVRAADDLGTLMKDADSPDLGVTPRLALLRSANPGVGFVTLVRLGCDTGCIVAVDAQRPVLRPYLERAAHRQWSGREESTLLSGRLFSVVAAAVRNPAGRPIAVLLVGVHADDSVRMAEWAAWQLVLTAWMLVLLVAVSAQGVIASSVTRRVRTLITRLKGSQGAPGPPRDGDELVELSQALDEAIHQSLERDRRHHARYQELVDNAPYGICQLDAQHRITAANSALARLIGMGPVTDLLGRDIRWCFTHLADGDALLTQCVAAERPESTEWSWHATDGSARTVRIACRPAGDGSQLIIEDVTERRALEAQLQQSQKMEALGRLTGGVAHDMNNLLTVILGNLAIARDRLADAPGEIPEELGAIEQAVGRGGAFIRKLLQFSRSDPVERQLVPVAQVVYGAGLLLRRVLPDDIRISLPTSAPEANIAVDQVQVEQMLLNLATNARDAMPHGGELVLDIEQDDVGSHEAGCLGLPSPGRYVVLSMRDTGQGIPVSIRGRVFDPFFTTKPPGAGSGLGLSMVYGLMQRHRGTVRLQPTDGKGTTMSLYFPEQPSTNIVDVRRELAPSRVVTRAQRARLLLVEDDPEVQRLTKMLLQKLGYVVEVADDGQEALAVLLADPSFAVVMSDVVMPRMGGLELLREARAAGLNTPFVFASGYSVESLETVAAEDGRVKLLTKPWMPARLGRLLADLLAEEQPSPGN